MYIHVFIKSMTIQLFKGMVTDGKERKWPYGCHVMRKQGGGVIPDKTWAVQSQKMARGSKFRIYKEVEICS